MSDFIYAYAQPSALTRPSEGDTLLLAAYAEHTLASGAACCFQGQLRDSGLTAHGLTRLVKVVASRSVPPYATPS